MQIGGDKPVVDIDRRAGFRGAQRAVLRNFPRVVIYDSISRGNGRADDFADLGVSRRAMKTGGDEDRDRLAWDSRLFQTRQQRRQNLLVGSGTRDVTNGDGRAGFASGELADGEGADGVIERGFNGGLRIG